MLRVFSVTHLVFCRSTLYNNFAQLPTNTLRSSSKAQNLPLPSNAATFTGDLTYYSPGPGYGACGFENTSADSICAVSHIIWDAASTSSNPNNNPLCGKMIRITRYDPTRGHNSSVDVEVVDRCVGCASTDLDLSLTMFDDLAEESQGRVVGSWAVGLSSESKNKQPANGVQWLP